MTTKTKNIKKSDQLAELARQTGLLLMTTAVTLGMLELPEHPNSRVVVPGQPAFALAENSEVNPDNPMRREREDTGPHYVSYSVTERTPSRSGRI